MKNKIFSLICFFTVSQLTMLSPLYGSDEYTTLLIHSDTTNGDTTFTDTSASNHTITPAGDTQHSTSQAKFGSTAMYFDGSGDNLTIPDSADWDFGTGDWTIDFWAYKVPATGYGIVFQTGGVTPYDSGGILFGFNGNAYHFQAGTASISFTGGSDLSNAWHHIALVREGDVLHHFVDGVQIYSHNLTGLSSTLFDSAHELYLGAFENGSYLTGYFHGYLDELRVSKGIARWTTDFSNDLPTAPYGPSVVLPTVTLEASSTNINAGQSTTLSWTTIDAVDCLLLPQNTTVSCNSQLSVSPTANTEYSLQATNPDGTSTASVTINVANGYSTAGNFTVDGKIGVGLLNPQYELAVNGIVAAKEVKVTMDGWPDYVFSKGYTLSELSSVEEFIDTNHHLPGIPSAQTIHGQGVSVGEMLTLQMKKIEELTLYLIEVKKENTSLKRRVDTLESLSR